MWNKQEAGYFKELEFGKTTVYKRKNPIYYEVDINGECDPVKVSEEVFGELDNGSVVYDEKQLTYREYYMELEQENDLLKMQLDSSSSLLELQEEVIQDIIFKLYE